MITDAMAVKLIEFYKENEINKKRRKKVKIIVDSLIEQLCKYYFNTIPTGIANVRVLVNKEFSKFNTLDQSILFKLKSVLRNYDDAFSKDYSDYNDIYNEFVNGDLKDLIIILLDSGFLTNNELKNQLKGLL